MSVHERRLPLPSFFRTLPAAGIALTVLAQSTFAATFYVSATASNGAALGDDRRTCAQVQHRASPMRTIMAAVRCMAGGDTVMVNEGTYTEEVREPPAGSEAQYTVIRADPASPRRPVIDPNGAALQRGFACQNGRACHHIRFQGFEVTSAFNNFTLQGTDASGYPHHIEIIDNVMHDTIHTGATIGAHKTTCQGGDHLIRGNVFYRTGSRFTDLPGNVNPYRPRHNTLYGLGCRTVVENNVFHDLANGVALWSSGATVRDNTVRNNVCYNIGREDLSPWLVGAGGSYACIHVSIPGSGHLIYNNVVYDSGTLSGAGKFSAIRVGTQAAGNVGGIFHNTIYGIRDGASFGILIAAAAAITEVRNNICYRCALGIRGGVQSDNWTSDPQFVRPDGASPDFHLSAGSPAIDRGSTIGSVKRDFDGVLRAQGMGYDIGAFEFSRRREPRDRPVAPSGLRVR